MVLSGQIGETAFIIKIRKLFTSVVVETSSRETETIECRVRVETETIESRV